MNRKLIISTEKPLKNFKDIQDSLDFVTNPKKEKAFLESLKRWSKK